jgi:four helix bundle protein
MTINSYEDLEVWKLGMEITESTYHLTKNFPSDEVCGLRLQMRKSAVSIPSNIAEGHERDGTKEYLHFLSIAKGSWGERHTQYLLAVRLKFIKSEDFQPVSEMLTLLGKKLSNLQKALRARL